MTYIRLSAPLKAITLEDMRNLEFAFTDAGYTAFFHMDEDVIFCWTRVLIEVDAPCMETQLIFNANFPKLETKIEMWEVKMT